MLDVSVVESIRRRYLTSQGVCRHLEKWNSPNALFFLLQETLHSSLIRGWRANRFPDANKWKKDRYQPALKRTPWHTMGTDEGCDHCLLLFGMAQKAPICIFGFHKKCPLYQIHVLHVTLSPPSLPPSLPLSIYSYTAWPKKMQRFWSAISTTLLIECHWFSLHWIEYYLSNLTPSSSSMDRAFDSRAIFLSILTF